MSKKRIMAQGYTIMELVVVLAMVGILAIVALPSFSQQIKNGLLTSNVNQLHSIFKFARSEAAKREENINLIVSDGKWLVMLGTDELSFFEPSHSSIEIDLKNLTISDTGATTNEVFTITDNDSDTDDYYMCIYISGQSTTSKTSGC